MAMTNAERQAAFRARRKASIAGLGLPTPAVVAPASVPADRLLALADELYSARASCTVWRQRLLAEIERAKGESA